MRTYQRRKPCGLCAYAGLPGPCHCLGGKLHAGTNGWATMQLEDIVGRRDEAAAHLDDMQAVLQEHQKAADQVTPTYNPPGPCSLSLAPLLVLSACPLAARRQARRCGEKSCLVIAASSFGPHVSPQLYLAS